MSGPADTASAVFELEPLEEVAATTFKLSVADAVWGVLDESVTRIVTLASPAVVGIPDSAPLLLFTLMPPGSPVADHVYGAVPPLTFSVSLYAVPAVAFGSEDVVI